jgi:hypothetical protein
MNIIDYLSDDRNDNMCSKIFCLSGFGKNKRSAHLEI